MRLFIAINFDEETKKKLGEAINALKSVSARGSFTRYDNLHLTLHFIGETDFVDDAKAVVSEVFGEPFTLKSGNLGRFARRDGDIWWLGLQKNTRLNTIYHRLADELLAYGFKVEERKFTPHLTLGRRVILKSGFVKPALEAKIPYFETEVRRISLMCSERIDGVLTYTEIYGKNLTD